MWYNSRWYDPYLNRWIQPDTVVPLESQGVQAFDRFAYCNNSPINFTDPSGHWIGGDAYDPAGAENVFEYNAFSRMAGRQNGNEKGVKSPEKYVSTGAIILDGGPGSASYGTTAEENWTGFYGSGEADNSTPGGAVLNGTTNGVALINSTLVWIRDNTATRELYSQPEVSGRVYYLDSGADIEITGFSISNQSYEYMSVSRISMDIYSGSSAYLSQELRLPGLITCGLVPIPPSPSVLDGNYALLSLSILSESGRYGTLTTVISK